MTTRLGACRQSSIKCPDNWCATARVIKSCLKCKARVEPLTAPLGRCSKGDCAMMQRYDLCTEQLSAWLPVLHCTSASDNRFYKTVHAFGSVVQQLAGVGDGEVTVDDLLNTPPFKTISYNDKNVVTGFTKEGLNCHIIIYWFSTSSRTVANPPLIPSSSWTSSYFIL